MFPGLNVTALYHVGLNFLLGTERFPIVCLPLAKSESNFGLDVSCSGCLLLTGSAMLSTCALFILTIWLRPFLLGYLIVPTPDWPSRCSKFRMVVMFVLVLNGCRAVTSSDWLPGLCLLLNSLCFFYNQESNLMT
jgi:hypothetical protein